MLPANDSTNDARFSKALFIFLCLICFLPFASPPLALAVGLVLALTLGNPFPKESRTYCGKLLKICVVLLGFSMNLGVVLRAGAQGVVLAAATIASTLLVGWGLGTLLHIQRRTSALISSGTAICGGSAIAAVGSVLGAAEGEMSVAMGTVFLLNAVALYLFPVVGHALHLSQVQFGTWAGVAIHDISSVVGAATTYGHDALQTATAVKLSRALWIIPLSLLAAYASHRVSAARAVKSGVSSLNADCAGKPKAAIPWFIGLFLVASLMGSYMPSLAPLMPSIKYLATAGLSLTLFLIGSGLSKSALKAVGWKPLVQGLGLWVFISVISLLFIKRFA